MYLESELVTHLKAKNITAFSYLYDNYSASLFGIVKRILLVNEQAEDCLQETFMKIWNHIDKFDDTKGRLFTWMANIARNHAIDITRSRDFRRSKKITGDENELAGYSDTRSVRDIDSIGISATLSLLAREDKNILCLFFMYGHTQVEIATILQWPLGTVKTRMRQALLFLRKELTDRKNINPSLQIA